jgi:hypothetical protein
VYELGVKRLRLGVEDLILLAKGAEQRRDPGRYLGLGRSHYPVVGTAATAVTSASVERISAKPWAATWTTFGVVINKDISIPMDSLRGHPMVINAKISLMGCHLRARKTSFSWRQPDPKQSVAKGLFAAVGIHFGCGTPAPLDVVSLND